MIPATGTRRPGRGASPPTLRPQANPRERAAVVMCLDCKAKTAPLMTDDPMPAGWRCQGGCSRVTWWCPSCAAEGGKLDAQGVKGVRP